MHIGISIKIMDHLVISKEKVAFGLAMIGVYAVKIQQQQQQQQNTLEEVVESEWIELRLLSQQVLKGIKCIWRLDD